MLRLRTVLCVVVVCATGVGLAADQDVPLDRDSSSVDAQAPMEPGGKYDDAHDGDLHRQAELIMEATLAKGLSFIPAPKRVVNTAYVFRVDEILKGHLKGEYVVVHDTGGILKDGRKMDTVESFKLDDGQQYLVFASRVEGEYWIENVLQVDARDQTVADASGRAIVGIQEGRVLLQPRPTRSPLRYTVPIELDRAEMDQPPTAGSLPLPGQPEAAAPLDAGAPLEINRLKEYVRAAAEGTLEDESISVHIKENAVEDTPPPTEPTTEQSDAEPRDFHPGELEFRLSGQHVTRYQSHYHFMPDNDNWDWTHHCRGAWNVLVNPKGGFRLFAYKINSSGNPIRNRLPVAGDGRFNVGVLSNAQMTSGGYDTWTSMGANGVCYRWWNSSNRLTETDILINPSIANDEVQFRKSFTHEYGHALTLDHERRYFALMYPGTFRQPPNYASLWYTRRDDLRGVRAMLAWVNSNIAAGTWSIADFADAATWSQSHPNPGTDANLVMTSISDTTLSPGDTATIRNAHVENRGSLPAQNTNLKFYLSTNNIISSGDREIASYTWNALTSYWTGNLNVRIPAGTPRREYYVGWVLTTDSDELSSSNNKALLLNDRTSAFSEVMVRIQ